MILGNVYLFGLVFFFLFLPSFIVFNPIFYLILLKKLIEFRFSSVFDIKVLSLGSWILLLLLFFFCFQLKMSQFFDTNKISTN